MIEEKIKREERKLKNTAFVKTCLMLLIIMYHSTVFWTESWWDTLPAFRQPIIGLFARWLNSFHIYSFTLISGYLFAFKAMRGEYSQYRVFIKNKARRLLIPYVFVTLIWIIPIELLLFEYDRVHYINHYFLCVNPSQLWFLWMLFDVFAIIWPIRKVLIEKPLTGWIISFMFYAIGTLGKHVLPNVFCIWTACQYVLFFFIGIRIRVKEERKEQLLTEVVPWLCWIGADLLIFATSLAIGQNDRTLWILLSAGLNCVLCIVGALMAWTSLQALAGCFDFENSKALKIISSYSMPVYLFHQQIIYFVIIWLDGKVNPWIHAGVNFVTALVISFLISSLLMRWKGTRILIGEK